MDSTDAEDDRRTYLCGPSLRLHPVALIARACAASSPTTPEIIDDVLHCRGIGIFGVERQVGLPEVDDHIGITVPLEIEQPQVLVCLVGASVSDRFLVELLDERIEFGWLRLVEGERQGMRTVAGRL